MSYLWYNISNAPVAQWIRASVFGTEGRGFESLPVYHFLYAPVAQWIEHWFPVPGVGGSTPLGCTIFLCYTFFMNPFEKLFKKKTETSEQSHTKWDNVAAEVPFNQAEEARRQNTARQQNKIIAAINKNNPNILNERIVDISHSDRQDFLDEVASGNIDNRHWDYIISNIADINNKRSEYLNSIKQLEQEAVAPRVSGDLYEVNGQAFKLTPEILKRYGLEPKDSMSIDGKTIAFSQPYDMNGRLACTAYITSTEGTKIVSYYRSRSSGSWRYLPDYVPGDDRTWYGKGLSEESLTLPFEMQKKLADISKKPPLKLKDGDALFAFFGTAKKYGSAEEYKNKKDSGTLRGVHYKESSPDFSFPTSASESFSEPEKVGLRLLNSPLGPNFKKEEDSFKTRTETYGDVTTKRFLSNDGTLSYIICETIHNGERQAWISNIEPLGGVTAVGTPKKWISDEKLTTPLYEYAIRPQAKSLGDTSDVNGEYESMWKNYLSKTPIIQKYLQETTPQRNRVA